MSGLGAASLLASCASSGYSGPVVAYRSG